ncbi:intracellular short-chain-length polyhydroxyalkanoate depolymerase [Ornithinibacillus californiensis]|uniref:intracellular short-chain-length polyhydroxyalkanoate depolymerase n=1 Tax=Ornithinibacillus californiensis TaxID=161536 RepID=UPI00064DC5C4|nr:alpha/beta hydrolase [Ornithinibacillus californiensis]
MANVNLKKVVLPNGEEIAYREREGGEDIIVLVHGNMTSSVHWDLVIDNLSERYKVYAIDMRGFGESSYNKQITAIKDFSEDLKLWVDEVGITDFALAGWSTGGCVSMQFCADYPGYCKALFLQASGSTRGYPYYPLGADGMPDLNNRIQTLDEMFKDSKRLFVQGAYDTKNYDVLRQVWEAVIYTHNKPDEERYQKYLEDMTTQRNLAEIYQALNTFNISSVHNGLTEGENRIKDINIPVLIAWGERDLVVTRSMTDEIREDFGDKAVYKELKGCGHSPIIDDLDQLLGVMEDFFSGVMSVN